MDPATVPGLIQAGGVIAFAAAVWWELRQQRIERAANDAATRAVLGEIRDNVGEVLGALGRRRTKTPAHGVPIMRGGLAAQLEPDDE